MFVYEYFLESINGIDYIKGYDQLDMEGNEHLKNNPKPIHEFIGPGWEHDEYGNLQWAIINNEIVHVPQEPSQHQQSLGLINKTKLFKILKALVNGIDTGGTGQKYNNLKTVMDRIENGF